jgi:hypothetical protein
VANMTVPSIRPGAKSLPAEMKIGNPRNMVHRFKAQHSGVSGLGMHLVRRGFRGLGGLGDDDTDILDLPGGGSVDTSTTITPITIPTINTSTYQANLDSITSDTNTVFSSSDLSAMAAAGAISSPPPGYSGPTAVAGNATPPAAPNGYQWASIVNSAGQTLSKVLAVAQGGTSVTLPNGTSLIYGSVGAAQAGVGTALSSLGTAVTSNLPILLAAGAALFLISMMGSKK